MTDIFSDICEHICSECINGNDDCYNGRGPCPFSSEFETLEALCSKVQNLANDLEETATRHNYWDEMEFSHVCGDF